MKLKKYYADNMQDALKIIKQEIGPDAVILSSKFVRKKKGFLGLFAGKQIEVVAGYEEKQAAQQDTFAPVGQTAFASAVSSNSVANIYAGNKPQQRPGKPAFPVIDGAQDAKKPGKVASVTNISEHAPQPVTPANAAVSGAAAMMGELVEQNIKENNEKFKKIDSLDDSIKELKDIVSGLTQKMDTIGGGGDKLRLSKEVRELYNKLIDNDVNRSIAVELCSRVEEVVSDREADPKEVLNSLILDMLGKTKPIQCTKFKRKTVMLIGPTGVGKTTTLVKLASKLLYEQKLDIGVINADVFRVAAKEHLKAYCEILNAEMITIYRQSEIVDALEAFKTKDIVFIDTAGKLSSNKQYQEEIRELVELGGIDDIYLLISASTSEKVIKSVINDYSFLKIHSIIVTKVDEVPTKGVVLHIARESGRPLSYMTIGQNVPDDIIELDPEEIANSVLES